MSDQPSSDERPFSDRLVLFLDFLGFAEAAKNWSGPNMAELVKLLIGLAENRGEFIHSGSAEEDGSFRVTFRPAITTFSDHIVLSYELNANSNPDAGQEQLFEVLLESAFDSYLEHCQSTVATIANAALSIGLLVRGGLTYGPLYHAHDVVIGPAMVEAYELESKIAEVPRIAVSDAVISRISSENRHVRFLEDDDGCWHLNYFNHMQMQVLETHSDNGAEWLKASASTIETNIKRLKAAKAFKEVRKWNWFRDEFAKGIGIDLEKFVTQPQNTTKENH